MTDENSLPPQKAEPEAAPPRTSGTAASKPPTTAAPGMVTVTTGMLIAGTYEIEQLINRGGMGEVYRGRNIHTGDPVAMKIVLPALAHDEMIEALFQKEAKVLGRLAHDAIVRYHTYMNPPEIGRPSLIMEFVEGKSLNDRIKEGPLPEDEVRVLLRRIASGLDRAHGAGVVHRDLSPDNIILEGEKVENAKIIDFGIAKSSMKGDRTLLQGQFAGKFSFVAPEQLGAFDGVIDGRTDVYALGLLIVACCRGKTLNMGSSIIEAVRSRSSVPDLAGVYTDLQPLLRAMLQPEPVNRPKSMAEVITFLDNPDLIPAPAPPTPEGDTDRTVLASQVPSASLPENLRGGAEAGTSSPSGTAAEFVGIPKQHASRAQPGVPQKSKGGLIAAALAGAVALAGAGAWLGGVFDTPVTPDDTPPPAPVATEAAPETGTQTAANDEARRAAEAAEAAAKAEAEAAAQAKANAEAEAGAKAEAEAAAKREAERLASLPQDDASKQIEWLRTYDAGECSYVSVTGGPTQTPKIEGFATRVEPFSDLLKAYTATHGSEPDIAVRLISATQCPVLDFMNELRPNRGIVPALVLDNSSDVLKSGETVSGRIEDLAGRSVSLFLVNGAGGATNLKPWISRSSDGTLGFSFTVNLAAGAEPTPQMLLAVVTERSVEKLDAVPNGVTARALIPFMKSELDRERQNAIGALRFFRLEN